MARFARIMAPGRPQHVTARGNRREPILFEDGDQDLYRDILGEQMRREAVEVWAGPRVRRIGGGRALSMCGAAGTGICLTVGLHRWPWTRSTCGKDDPLATVAPIIGRVKRFGDLLATDPTDPDFAALRASESTGRSLGSAAFVADLERRLGRPIAKRTPGRKPGGGTGGGAGSL